MKIGVTGASGFLGSILVPHLADGAHDVRALTRTLPTRREPTSRVQWQQGDLNSPHDAIDFARDLDVIVHLAWTNTPLTSNAHLPTDAAVNMLPSLTLLEAVREIGEVPHIVFASSGGTVYGAAREQRPFREDDECRPQSSYGIEKLAVEHYLRMASERKWLTATVLRIGNPYGVLLPPERLQGFIGTAISQVRSGGAIRVFGNRANVRDFLFVTDMCRAFDAALIPNDVFDVFNIGTGHGYSVDDVLRLIQELEGRPLPVEIESSAAAQELPSWVVLDVHKAAERLGWAPEVTLENGVCQLLAESRHRGPADRRAPG